MDTPGIEFHLEPSPRRFQSEGRSEHVVEPYVPGPYFAKVAERQDRASGPVCLDQRLGDIGVDDSTPVGR